MGIQVLVKNLNQDFTAAPNETVLTGALRNGINFPHSCQNGRCGMCKSRLQSGEVDHLAHNKFTLTDEEKVSGLILACKAIPKTDVVVSWVAEEEEFANSQSIETKVVQKNRLTHDTWRVVLEAESHKFKFKPGQYSLLNITGFPPRNYSMSNQPNDRQLEFYIRQLPGGLVSNYVNETLKEGDSVTVIGPLGSSYLRVVHAGPILLVAGGSGIAPIKSILDAAITNGMRQAIYLYFGVREEQDVYLLDHFRKLREQFPNFVFNIVVDRGSTNKAYRSGRLNDAIKIDFPAFHGKWNAYLAGPPQMVESVSNLIIMNGISKSTVWSDPFVTTEHGAVK
ncbi:MAG: 2Fe-2S iron-sulfur cluster-binding protein [Bdellovibrionales bacterium]